MFHFEAEIRGMNSYIFFKLLFWGNPFRSWWSRVTDCDSCHVMKLFGYETRRNFFSFRYMVRFVRSNIWKRSKVQIWIKGLFKFEHLSVFIYLIERTELGKISEKSALKVPSWQPCEQPSVAKHFNIHYLPVISRNNFVSVFRKFYWIALMWRLV